MIARLVAAFLKRGAGRGARGARTAGDASSARGAPPTRPAPRDARPWLAGTLALALATTTAGGQGPDPRRDWRTIATPHFRVHYSEGLEAEARRAAANAERAWAELAAELVPPRGPVELVVADNVDFTQGYATPFPTNRIVVFAQPPVELFALRFYDDWSRLVITHELVHVFHLDRSRGLWGALQRVFGRSPVLFPNAYSPSWVVEGLAVYYESRLTSAGRLAGTEHRLIARAAAAEGRVPRLDQLSLGSSVFPGGTQAYAYGSLVFDHLASGRGPERVRDFVERASGQLIPFRLDRAARRSFGVSFSDAWRGWRDSVARSFAAEERGATPWRELTREGWYAGYPRWLDTGRVVYASNDGRAVAAAYRVDLAGARERLGRRNSLSPNVPLPDGATLFSQLDYVDPFTVRSDLYVQAAGARAADFGAASAGQRRLTRGARLSHPDARADGEIVAVQSGEATTRLARVSRDGRRVAPLTRATRDTQWTEPRWSPDGRAVAAVALTPGARSAVVVLDTLGRVARVVAEDRAVNVGPSWSPDGRRLYWTSDRTGAPQVYVADVADVAAVDAVADAVAAPAPRRLSAAAAGMLHPVPSPDGDVLAALAFRGDGYHVAVADTASLGAPGAGGDASAIAAAPAAAAAPPVTAAARPYRPWRTLVPRYWLPVAGTSDGNSTTLGASTSGRDVIGRHAYAATATANVHTADVEWRGDYRYMGLGQPSVDVSASQEWQYDSVLVTTGTRRDTVGLFRRTREAALSLGLVRRRVRTGASLSVGALVERRAYASPDPALVARAGDRIGRTFPAVFASGAWSNTRRPARSISPEDGVAVSGSAQHRWQDGRLGPSSQRAVGTLRVYKSLDLPGFAHHVLAARVAGAVADRRSASEFTAGGVSGSAAEVAPGVTLGDPARTFGVRGFGAGAQRGLRAAAASVEYRAPVTIAGRGFRLLPVFLDRLSATAFAEAATAWCPTSVDREAQTLCLPSRAATPERPRWLASAGAELGLDAALDYDAPYRFRLGVAAPVRERARAPRGVSAYFTLGTAF